MITWKSNLGKQEPFWSDWRNGHGGKWSSKGKRSWRMIHLTETLMFDFCCGIISQVSFCGFSISPKLNGARVTKKRNQTAALNLHVLTLVVASIFLVQWTLHSYSTHLYDHFEGLKNWKVMFVLWLPKGFVLRRRPSEYSTETVSQSS